MAPTAGDDNNLTLLFRRIQGARNDQACAELWDAVYVHVTILARKRLSALSKRIADEEDIALSAINSFVRAAESGRLSSIQNRDELWRVLITITSRKANAFQGQQLAEKRGNGHVRGDSVFESPANEARSGFDSIEDPLDPHRFVDELLGECRERIDSLPDETLRTIALRRMEGFEVNEIASELTLSVATIKRKLARIRDLWAEDAPRLPQ